MNVHQGRQTEHLEGSRRQRRIMPVIITSQMQRIARWSGIYTPGPGQAGGTGSVEGASSEIGLEGKSIRSIHIPVTGKISITGIGIHTWSLQPASPEILLEGKGIRSILIPIIIEITFAFTGIPASVASGGE